MWRDALHEALFSYHVDWLIYEWCEVLRNGGVDRKSCFVGL